MSRVHPSDVIQLQKNTDNIRNFCILAHVDHGKTTLSDSLVCSNGVISPKLAGKIRFLDSTEEEQRRGITMHSSAISLSYKLENPNQNSEEEFLINLIDSPGHIDFSSDVSAATRICDGALIVIDVLEGLCTQTHAVLHKALKERMKPCIVLNKLDRLAIEMKLSPVEAFHHLRRIIEHANALAFTLLTSEVRLMEEQTGNSSIDLTNENEQMVKDWTFSPESGNVIFASALDCWGFGIMKFANIWSKKLGVNKALLQKYLFDDYCFNSKTMKIVKYDATVDNGLKPMFATMILDPIWQLYDAAVVQQDPAKAAKMAQRGLNVEILPREVSTRDPRFTLQTILRKWLPLPDSLLRMVVRCMPSPRIAQRHRSSVLQTPVESHFPNPTNLSIHEQEHNEQVRLAAIQLAEAIDQCDTSNCDDVVVFVSKMTPVKVSELCAQDIQMLTRRLREKAAANDDGIDTSTLSLDPSSEVVMALGRVYCGCLTRKSPLFVIGHRHNIYDSQFIERNPKDISMEWKNSDSVTRIPENSIGLYLCLGPSVFPVEEGVPAGNIVGIIGVEDYVQKTTTLASSWACPPMKAITFQAKPMVRVAVEPKCHEDLPLLVAGLKSLYQYDPVVEIGLEENGQHTMTCLGELHRDFCVKTLQEKFVRREIIVSEPLVSYYETVIYDAVAATLQVSPVHYLPPPWCEIPNLQFSSKGKYRQVFSSGNMALSVRCIPLPMSWMELWEIESNINTLSSLKNFFESRSFDALGTYSTNLFSSPLWKAMSQSVASTATLSGAAVDSAPSNVGATSSLSSSLLSSSSPAAIDSDLQFTVDQWHSFADRLICIGPSNPCSNAFLLSKSLTVDIINGKISQSTSHSNEELSNVGNGENNNNSSTSCVVGTLSWDEISHRSILVEILTGIHSALVTGFQMAVSKGPMMDQPMRGVCFVVEKMEFSYATFQSLLSPSATDTFVSMFSQTDIIPTPSIMTGQVISEVLESLRLAMLSCPLRIVEPIYACDLQCDQSQLGNLYNVLSKRRGIVTKEDIIDGTSLFLLSATLPVAESFGFAQELLKKTSGNATAPQLKFSHLQIMDINPFWKPLSEEEMEEFGDQSNDSNNRGRQIVDAIRKRKGLPIEEKVVMFAEKQRTLKKN